MIDFKTENCRTCLSGVIWLYLSPLLDLLLLSISLLHVPHEESLSQELLGSAAGLDVQEGIVGVFNHALTESTDAQLHHGPVVQDLREKKSSARKPTSNHTNQLFFS